MDQVQIGNLDFLILSIVVLFVGMRLTRAIPLLERNYIPPAVTGGVLFSVGAPLVGASFIDITNAAVIKLFIGGITRMLA